MTQLLGLLDTDIRITITNTFKKEGGKMAN